MTLTGGIVMDAGVAETTISTDVALGGPLTIEVADADALLTISGGLSGDNALTKTGDGTLALATDAHTGDTTVGAGTLVVGSLPSVFDNAMGAVSFDTVRPDAALIADPGDSGGTFGLTVAGLTDGTVGLNADGFAWNPSDTCQPDAYTAVPATYTYTGGSQTRAFVLNIANDIPRHFRSTDGYQRGFGITTMSISSRMLVWASRRMCRSRLPPTTGRGA